MKSIMRYFSMAALVVAVATLVGCTKEEINNGLTFTTTVEMPSNVTKDLTENGVKTFKEGDCIKVTCSGAICTSEPLTTSDISADGKAAKFTFNFASAPTLTEDTPVTYEYPAAYSSLDGQNGSLTTLASTYDYARCETTVTVEGKLPTNIQLENQYAILKLIVKNSGTDVTKDITGLTITNGANTVTVSRTPAAGPTYSRTDWTYIAPVTGPIYVAVPAVTSGDIVFSATDGTNVYEKTVSGKTLAQGSLYPVELAMNVNEITWNNGNFFKKGYQEISYWDISSYTYGGITISSSITEPGSAFRFGSPDSPHGSDPASLLLYGNYGDSFTFTAPAGKVFTNIVITDNENVNINNEDGGWTQSGPIIEWNGNANAVTLGPGNGLVSTNEINSIVFTMQDAE